MKNKPLRHKELNTFKFIPFSERISNVKIDVVHQIKHKYELDAEETTFFYQTYEKWILLNCTQSFEDLRRDITPDVRTLPQLLARKDELINVLKDHLALKNPLNLKPLLEFIVALAKDIRQEFYPYFSTFYPLIVSLLDVKDAEQLEWAFECLAYLFKFLWRYLLNNLSSFFDSLLPLLDDSKPYYINNFAAQSFAFVARKIKDESKLIRFIVRPLKEKPQAIEGCGRLLFEIIRGISGHFHSCGEKILSSFISALRDTTYPHSILRKLLSHTITQLISFLHSSQVNTLWKILQGFLNDFHEECKINKTERNEGNVYHTLHLIQICVEFKSSSQLVEPNSLITLLLRLLEPNNQINGEITDCISNILSYILLSSRTLPQELSSRIVIGAMTYMDKIDLLTFVLRIVDYSGFDGLVLSRLLSFCLEKTVPELALPFLAKIVLHKAPPASDTRQLMVWRPYSLNFSFQKEQDLSLYSQSYLKILMKDNIIEHLEDFENSILVLYVLPHVLPIQKEEVVLSVKLLIEMICDSIAEQNDTLAENDLLTKKTDDALKLNKLLFMLSIAIETLIYLKPDDCITKILPPVKILPILLNFSSTQYTFVLRALDFYISVDELNLLVPHAAEIRKRMCPLLLSPYQKVHLHTTHILFEIDKSSGENEITSSVLETCWLAECVPVTLHDYRDKLKILQKLDCSNDSFKNAILRNITDGRTPLSYLLGVLFLNFKLMWEPVSNIIKSYGSTLTPVAFWDVFGKQLEEVAQIIRESKNFENVTIDFKCEHLAYEFKRLNILSEIPDYPNYRIMLWNILKDLPDVYEYKSKNIVELFLSFLELEYNKRYSEAASSWDIRLKTHQNEIVDTSDIDKSQLKDDSEMDIDEQDISMETDNPEKIPESKNRNSDALKEEDTILSSVEKPEMNVIEINLNLETISDDDVKKKLTEEEEPESDWKTKWITKSLLAHTGIFGKFRSPKSLYKEPELNRIFLDFLSSRVADIQRNALDFILSYKLKYLTPYKEHLYGLIDDKTFKNELSVFRIDTQSDLVRPEHRPHLVPIVLRIVYSKMYSKVNSSRRETKQSRKAAILRFLTGCSNEELSNFFKMAFSHFLQYIEDSSEEMVDKIMRSINFKECIPPRRLLSTAHLLSTVISYCGGLLKQDQIAFLLRLILIVASHPPIILEKREEVHPGYVKVMRNVKMRCFEVISHFYQKYDKYDFTEDEINALFKVAIWPYLTKLTFEGVNSPTALLKMFIIWSKNYRFFPLLDKKNEDGLSPLSAMMDLWSLPKLHLSVHNTLVDLICNLLIPLDEDEDGVSGLEILNSYMPKILQILQNRLCSKKSLSKKELSILSAVTSEAKESISSESLLSLVLPSLLKPAKKNDEEITDLLNTVGNLVIKSNEPTAYLKRLVILFSSLRSPGHRKLLVTTSIMISKHTENTLDEDLLLDLNAWDPKWVEQPDFNKRLQAFTNIEEMNNRLDPLLAAIIIRTSYHYLKDEKDLSMKDSARHCLKTLCPKVCLVYCQNKEELSFLLDETIFPLIKSGLNDLSDVFRQECISLLGVLVRECGSIHTVLRDLIPFSCKTDLEVDFFENLVHLQLHRRVRAMLRFSEISQKLEHSIYPRNLVLYVLPMISQYLLSPKYADKNTIIDSAIKALGTLCSLLSWRYYSAILRSYLGKLQSGTDFQKQLIRIVSEILNAFHFNLSQAEELNNNKSITEEIKEELPKETEENKEKYEQDNSLLLEELPGEEATVNDDEGDELKDSNPKTNNCSKEIALDKLAANRVIYELSGVILPNLQKLLGEKSFADSFHKVNKRMSYSEKDEEDILRIPLAIAIVKLLQKLPSSSLLERNLPGIFLKLANYLKSRSESVRKTARTTLETIMTSLGPQYLPKLTSELCSILTKGFHVHVLTYTVHGVLNKLKPFYSKGDIDPCLQKILSVCIADLFGSVSEEKEVNQIVSKTIEARANRSYDIFHILGAYASEKYLLDIILPLKEELSQSVLHKTIKKASDCLQQIALGLTENEYLPPESLLELAYGLSTESIPALTAKEKDKRNAKQLEYESRRDPDVYLIPEEPKQKKALITTECIKTNAHILVEFGLKLLYFLLKREKLNKHQFKHMLDPLVKLLLDCLYSQHVKVSTIALKCFAWVLKMDLPSVNNNIKEISSTFLEILHKYAAAGLSKGDNFDLVMAAFKAVSVLVRSVPTWKPDNDDRRVLLLYCEQDIDDRERQATAFSLLKALIQKGVTSVELDSVMKKVATVSITSPMDSVRLQARQVMLTYLMEYKLGKVVLTYLSFYLSQLSYETKIGRESALEMIRSLVSAFPKKTLHDECGLIFVNVATRLVNEDDPDCKKEAAALIVLLLQKLEQNGRDKLFDVTTTWIGGKKVLHRRLGMQLVGLFATAEKDDFSRRFESFFSLTLNELRSGFSSHKPGRFILLKVEDREEETDQNGDNPSDHLAFHTLQSLIKIFTLFPNALKDNKYSEEIEIIQDECQALLAHEHEWVRTLAVQVLGLILTTKQSTGTKSMALDLLSQLIPSVGETLLMQTMKLLVHIAQQVSLSPNEEFTLLWIIRKVRQAVNKEIVHSPSSSQIRKIACRWGAALSLKLNRTELGNVAFDLLTPIVKEMNSGDEELAKAAKEAGGYIKGKLGQSEYNNLVAQISQNIEAKKALRKKERTQLAVTDPERAAKRKINKQLKKKVLKKRKVELMKNHKFKRKPKKTDVDLEQM